MEQLNKILEQFIEEKTKSYTEPQRKGVPKGDPIGFSLIKYKATLHMLEEKKMKEVADDIGVSYTVLRRWNTETEFGEMIDKHKKEFVDFFHKKRVAKDIPIKEISRLSDFLDESGQQDLRMTVLSNRRLLKEAIKILNKPESTDEEKKDAIRYISTVVEST
jgi:HD-like signal output (HDOD) protein